jgi:hypothetical protein
MKQRARPMSKRTPPLIGGVFLDEMAPLHRRFGLVRPGAATNTSFSRIIPSPLSDRKPASHAEGGLVAYGIDQVDQW